jgi:hypothetical protein
MGSIYAAEHLTLIPGKIEAMFQLAGRLFKTWHFPGRSLLKPCVQYMQLNNLP